MPNYIDDNINQIVFLDVDYFKGTIKERARNNFQLFIDFTIV